MEKIFNELNFSSQLKKQFEFVFLYLHFFLQVEISINLDLFTYIHYFTNDPSINLPYYIISSL